MIVGHVIDGPADAIIELGLPLLIFAALWWWSARRERERGSGSSPRGPSGSAGTPGTAGPSEHPKRKSEADGGPKATPLDKERRT